eukprot:m.54282 g.54282  ORF g.54282 m.54282 type:complete len:189 (+) comp13613_c0_seq1:1315-1881(+)
MADPTNINQAITTSKRKSAKVASSDQSLAKRPKRTNLTFSAQFQRMATFHTTNSKLSRQVRMKRQGGEIVQGCDMYLGRQCNMGGWRLPKSPLFNPFSVKACQGSAMLAVYKYAEHLKSSEALLMQLPALYGKELGCWCGSGQACHARLVAALVNKAAEATEGSSAAPSATIVVHIKKQLGDLLVEEN